MDQLPFVSIVIPCRNEETFIGPCLDSVLRTDYPLDRVEVIVVDGMSEDKTRDTVRSYAARYEFIRLIENPKRTAPAALNIGIRQARGDVIMLMGAHATYDRRYVSTCVSAMQRWAADNVGGVLIAIPRRPGAMAQAIAATFNHRLGAGNARYRMGVSTPTWVDTVFGGCYRRSVFDRVGLFNESLVRNQDYEFNVRLKRAGGKTLLTPDAVAYYYIRSDLRSFMRQSWLNGAWVILSAVHSRVIPLSWRHLMPLGFAMAVGAVTVLGAVAGRWWPLGAVGAAYAAAVGVAAVVAAWRRRNLGVLWAMPLAFAALHVPYGAGSAWGVLKALWLLARGRAGASIPSFRDEFAES